MMHFYLKMVHVSVTGYCSFPLQWGQRVRNVLVSCWFKTYRFVFCSYSIPAIEGHFLVNHSCEVMALALLTRQRNLWPLHCCWFCPRWSWKQFCCLTAIFTLKKTHTMRHATLWQTWLQLPRADCTPVPRWSLPMGIKTNALFTVHRSWESEKSHLKDRVQSHSSIDLKCG